MLPRRRWCIISGVFVCRATSAAAFNGIRGRQPLKASASLALLILGWGFVLLYASRINTYWQLMDDTPDQRVPSTLMQT